MSINKREGTMSSYITGFVLSIILTLSSYLVVTQNLIPKEMVIAVIIFLALLQFVVQAIFFLHLDKETGPRWNLIVFLSTLSIVILVVIGSIWIMTHLNYNVMPQKDVGNYIKYDEGIAK